MAAIAISRIEVSHCRARSIAIAAAVRREDCNPLGRKELGKKVVGWIERGMQALTAEIAEAERARDLEAVERRMGAGAALVAIVQPFLDEIDLPEGQEDQCQRARNHYPTLYDHFQRELRQALVALQDQGCVEDWQRTDSWNLLKEKAKSDDHRSAARIQRSAKRGKEAGAFQALSEEAVAGIQAKVDAFVDRYLELLSIERQAELAATQRALDGVAESSSPSSSSDAMEDEDDFSPSPVLHEECGALSDLVAIGSFKGLGGNEVVSFQPRDRRGRLPPTSLSPGDMVCVRVSSKLGVSECLRGSVYELCEDGQSIQVALPGGSRALMKLSGRSIKIDKVFDLANATTYERNCEALKQLKECGTKRDNPAAAIVAVLFGEGDEISKLARGDKSDPPPFQLQHSPHDPPPFSKDLDESQTRAIHLGLDKSRPVTIIQGPPGTGKTKVVTAIIASAVARGERVLATAPTNAAVDNLVERLADAGLRVVRVGNPARVSPAALSRSLAHIVESELADLRRELARCKRGARSRPELAAEARRVERSARRRESEIPRRVLASAEVVLCTNVGAGDPLVAKVAAAFDLAVVDEAGQAMEAASWIALLRSARAVVAGDASQLAPTVFSIEAAREGLAMSLMERAATMLPHSSELASMLRVQYRMNAAIASWASREMYGGLLESAPAVASSVLADSPGVEGTWRTRSAMLLLDTRQAFGSLSAGCEECMDYLGTGSFYNDGEADIVVEHVKALVHAGVAAQSIAVQSPYLAQVHLLRARLEDANLADTVQAESIDSFQGREADAVVISMVRSNELGAVGFLADKRRINVAVTRARKHVAIVCDSSTVGSNPFLLRLLQHIRAHGHVVHREQQQQALLEREARIVAFDRSING